MKTPSEWLLAFNQYYNNIMSNRAPGLEPIEISRFLTDAEYAIVIGLDNGSITTSFEGSEQVTDYLATLVKQITLNPEDDDALPVYNAAMSYVFKLPDGVLFRKMEICTLEGTDCGDSFNVQVVPVTQDELIRTMRNPYKRPNNRRVLRLSYAKYDNDEETAYSELVSKYKVKDYAVRYLARPKPIIVPGLVSGQTIDGYPTPHSSAGLACELPEPVHQMILEQAVKLAKAVWAE